LDIYPNLKLLIMNALFQRTCLYDANLAQKRDKKSKAIELLKFRQCRDTCCPKRFTSKRGEELINRGFVTTDNSKSYRSRRIKSLIYLELFAKKPKEYYEKPKG